MAADRDDWLGPSPIEAHLINIRLHALDAAISFVSDDAGANEILQFAKRFEHYLTTGETYFHARPLGPALDTSRDVELG
jgi:hypothetical protein